MARRLSSAFSASGIPLVPALRRSGASCGSGFQRPPQNGGSNSTRFSAWCGIAHDRSSRRRLCLSAGSPASFVGLGKTELAGLHGIKHGSLNDGRVVVGDDVPRFSVLQAASGAAYFENRPLADHIHAGVAFVGQNAENGGCTPNPVAAGNIMGVIAVRCLVFSGCRNTAPEKLPRDGSGVHAACGKAENELHNGSSLRVRLHSAIGAFAVAVGTDFALILAALHLGVLGALGF